MHIPKYLYKYRSMHTKKDREHTLRILTHNEIYFAKCTEFNDPFDCNLHISCEGDFTTHKEKLRKLKPDLSEAKLDIQTQKDLQPENIKKRERKVNKDIRHINQKVGIFSMSAKPDDLLMWSHYADYHRGICIKFKTTSEKLFGCDILNIKYKKNFPIFSVYDDMNLKRVKKYTCTKSIDWKYEKEWRIYYRETGCQLFPPEEISGVILGSRISNRNKAIVLKCLSETNCKEKIYEAHECKDRFGLDIIPIK
jgi:hypothetical protein